MKNLSQYKIVFLILLIVSIGFIFHMVETYREQKNDIVNWETTTNLNVDRLYAHVFQNAENTLLFRAKTMMKLDHDAKVEALRTNNTDQIRRLFIFHFETIKEQIPGFDIMQIISPEGKSMYRFHRPDEYGDDLTSFRPTVKNIVKDHQPIAFFESGVHGMYFRYIHPIFEDGKLIAFIEMGIQPNKLLGNTAKILNLQSYIYKKDTRGKQNTFVICESCRDAFIMQLGKKIDFSADSQIIQSGQRHYLVITKAMLDGIGQTIGKSVLIQDIEFLYTELNQSLINNIMTFILSGIIVFFLLNAFIKKLLTRTREIQLLLDNANDAVYLIRLEDGQIIDANLRASAMLQYSIEELRSKKVTDIRRPINGKQFSWQTHINELRYKHFMTSRSIHKRKDSTEFPVEAALSYIVINNVEHMIAVARDITEQLKLEHSLEEHNKELEHLEHILSESALYTTSDLKGNITYISDALLKLTGYKRGEVMGKNHSIFKHKDNSKDIYRVIWQTIEKDNQSWEGEMQNRKKNGDSFWVHLVIKQAS